MKYEWAFEMVTRTHNIVFKIAAEQLVNQGKSNPWKISQISGRYRNTAKEFEIPGSNQSAFDWRNASNGLLAVNKDILKCKICCNSKVYLGLIAFVRCKSKWAQLHSWAEKERCGQFDCIFNAFWKTAILYSVGWVITENNEEKNVFASRHQTK